MELFLLQIAAFLRPIFFIEVHGSNLFDLAAIGIFAALTVALLANAAVRKDIRLSTVDFMIVAFGVWCISIYFIYWEEAHVREVARLLIPLFTYTVTKNILTSRAEYKRLMFLILLGYIVPILFSMILILNGKGIEYVSYWTGAPRWQGAYLGAHAFGHNMTFLLMVVIVYVSLAREGAGNGVGKTTLRTTLFLGCLSVLALVGLGLSRVRTAILGLLVVAVGYGWFHHKKLLLAVGTVAVILLVVLGPFVFPILFVDVYQILEGRADLLELGSGRMSFWIAAFDIFVELPLDQKFAGIGIGNKNVSYAGTSDPHNDWIYLVMNTGLVGAGLFITVQLLILKAILKLPQKERYLFLAVFGAIQLMNLVSNSYISRFGLAQMYYMMIAFAEMRFVHGHPDRKDDVLRAEKAPRVAGWRP